MGQYGRPNLALAGLLVSLSGTIPVSKDKLYKYTNGSITTCITCLINFGRILSNPGDLLFFKLLISLNNSSLDTGSQNILFFIDGEPRWRLQGNSGILYPSTLIQINWRTCPVHSCGGRRDRIFPPLLFPTSCQTETRRT